MDWIQATVIETTLKRPLSAIIVHLLYLFGLSIGFAMVQGANDAMTGQAMLGGGGGFGPIFGFTVVAIIGLGIPTAVWLGVLTWLKRG